MKRCVTCGETKQLKDFYQAKDTRDGLTYSCKECRKAKSRAYYARNTERVIKASKAYYDNNPQTCTSQRREYYRRNAAIIKQRVKEWTEANREQTRLNKKISSANRRDKNLAGSITKQQWIDLCAKYGNCCLCCGSSDSVLTIDHIVPVSAGGSSDISNIQPLCLSCNDRKAQRTIDYRRED